MTFGYDAAGALAVKTVRQGSAVTTTHYIGGYYERTVGGATRRYYRLGDQLVLYDGTAYHYLYGDHLNSATLTTNAAGAKTSETRYFPYGAHRFDWGSDPSDRDFTGQRRDVEVALLDYVARRYSPYLGRFVSPDTIIPDPGSPQDLNRYAYVRNNPLKFVDPSGHLPIPPQIPILEILKHPYVRPLLTNPLIGAPVILGLYREAQGDAPEALSLTVDWYFERGDAPREFSGDSKITQSFITSKGMQEARQKFIEGGGKDMGPGGDKKAYRHEYTEEEYVSDLGKAFAADDWSAAMIGSFDVELKNVPGYGGPGRMVDVTVVNDTGWASATKIPILKVTILQNADRDRPGPGGTLWQYYRWREVINAE